MYHTQMLKYMLISFIYKMCIEWFCKCLKSINISVHTNSKYTCKISKYMINRYICI